MLHCGDFPGPSFGPNNPMRVNCGHSDTPANYVRLSTNKDLGISLAELEVYTLGNALHSTMINLVLSYEFRKKNQSPIYLSFSCFWLFNKFYFIF